MKTTTILITLLIASASLQQGLVKGCAFRDSVSGRCINCYRRQLTTHGCGPLLPETNNCLFHGEKVGQEVLCYLCKPGYLITSPRKCVPGSIFNCVFGVTTNGISTCFACGSGQYPTADRLQCAPLAKGAIPNCLWGEADQGDVSCSRCNAGYVVAYDKQSCVPVTAATTGCWNLGSQAGSCQICDVQAGYSMQKNGKCKFIKKE